MRCRICESNELSQVLDLGVQPWANHFLKIDEIGSEPSYPLTLMHCTSCFAVQLDYTVKKEIMFSDHTYLSGVTDTLIEHFKSIAFNVENQFGHLYDFKNILDIGSNDGTQLKQYKKLGWEVLGVESSKQISRIANSNGVQTINEFFNADCAKKIGLKFSIINASGVFFHLEELHSVTEGVKESLKENGVFTIQFLYMKSITENVAFDQIYHEHLLYYNLETLNVLLRQHGLEIFDCYLTPAHGGQMVAYVSHKNKFPISSRFEKYINCEIETECNSLKYYMSFVEKIKKVRSRNLEYLWDLKANNKRIFGMGAPVKGNTLLNYFGINNNLLDCLLEKNVLRKGLYAPGSHLPIYMEDEVHEIPDAYYVLAWNFKKEILRKNKDLIDRGVEFFFPIEIE